jgi:hypothetical protein
MNGGRGPAQELRGVIDRLPLGTRQAMLEGIRSNRIVVGGNVDMSGGVCPMVAAHRRASARLGRAFGQAWDRYAHARLPRTASERELRTLHSMLEASIQIDSEAPVSLSAAISEHLALRARRQPSRIEADGRIHAQPRFEEKRSAKPKSPMSARRPRRDTGERDRTRELRGRHGWAWLRPVRRYEDFERALDQVEQTERGRPEVEERSLAPAAPGR